MKKKKKEDVAETHPALKGLDIRVNEFGEIISNISVEKLNDFLNDQVIDKKLNEDEWEKKKREEQKKIKHNVVKRKSKK